MQVIISISYYLFLYVFFIIIIITWLHGIIIIIIIIIFITWLHGLLLSVPLVVMYLWAKKEEDAKKTLHNDNKINQKEILCTLIKTRTFDVYHKIKLNETNQVVHGSPQTTNQTPR